MAVGNVFRGFTWNHDKDKHKDQGNKNRACRAKTMVSEFSFQQFNKNHLLDLVFLLLLADGLVFSSQSNRVQAKPEGVWREPKRYEGMNRGDLESNH